MDEILFFVIHDRILVCDVMRFFIIHDDSLGCDER